MTQDELSRIEQALQIQLPVDYRQLVLNYPIRADEGRADSILWDDPDALIEMNQKYREGFAGMKPWPPDCYLVGDDGAASTYVIQTGVSPSPVHFLDHGNPDRSTEESQSLDEWIRDYIESNDIDTSADRQEPSRFKIVFMVIVTIAIGAAIGGVYWQIVG